MGASYQLKPEQDGMGFFYGDLHLGEAHHRIDLLPPLSYSHPWFVGKEARRHMDPTKWRVFIDGEQIATTDSREDAERAMRDWNPVY
jgi:hypothetical protein